MDRDQADRFLGRERAEPLLHLGRRQPIAARAHQIDADEVAVLGAAGVVLGDVEFAAGLLLVDRNQAAAAGRQRAKNAEQAGAGVIDDLDDAAAIRRAVAVIGFLDPQQRAVADTGGGAGLRPARHMDANFRRGSVVLAVPLGGRGEQFAVGVAPGDVGHHGRGQGGRLEDLAAALGDRAVVGEFAQDLLQRDAVGVLQAELARDFAGADVAGIRANEGDDGVPAWKTIVGLLAHLSPGLARALFRGRFGCGRLGCRGLGGGSDRRARLADGVRLRFRRRLLHRGLLGRLWRVGIGRLVGFSWRQPSSVRPSWRRASACRRPWRRVRRSARWLPPSVIASGVLSLGIVALTPPDVT